MSDVRLSICTGDYDRVQALKADQVKIAGCSLEYLTLDPGSTFQRLFRRHEFDIAEMSFSTYMLALSKGDFPYRAIPIFLSRVFPHGSIYVRTDRGIHTPQDLKGKRVGIPSYHFTRGLVVRGMLADEYSVTPRDIRWRIGVLIMRRTSATSTGRALRESRSRSSSPGDTWGRNLPTGVLMPSSLTGIHRCSRIKSRILGGCSQTSGLPNRIGFVVPAFFRPCTWWESEHH